MGFTKFEEQIYYLIFVLLFTALIYSLEAKELNILWSKCVYKNKILPCKLINDAVYINGKEVNASKLDTIYKNNSLYVLLGE